MSVGKDFAQVTAVGVAEVMSWSDDVALEVVPD